MKEFIKTYNEGKATGASSMTISDDGIIVLFKKEYELDNSVFPPVMKEKSDTVQKAFTKAEIAARIAELQEEIELLQEFQTKEVEPEWVKLDIDAKIAVKEVVIAQPK